jgi:hypothetical protein
MLAVCEPERRRLLLHPAPPPGGVAPAWINVAPAARPLGQLPAVGFEDLADLAIQRCSEELLSGRPASVQAYAAVVRLAWQMERDEAIPARDMALAEVAEARAVMLSLKDAIIRRSGQDEWRSLGGEVREELERARRIREARQRFVSAARYGGRRGGGLAGAGRPVPGGINLDKILAQVEARWEAEDLA